MFIAQGYWALLYRVHGTSHISPNEVYTSMPLSPITALASFLKGQFLLWRVGIVDLKQCRKPTETAGGIYINCIVDYLKLHCLVYGL